MREHRGASISIKLIPCQEKNEVESRAAHPFGETDGARGRIGNRPEGVVENRLTDGSLANCESVAVLSSWLPASTPENRKENPKENPLRSGFPPSLLFLMGSDTAKLAKEKIDRD